MLLQTHITNAGTNNLCTYSPTAGRHTGPALYNKSASKHLEERLCAILHRMHGWVAPFDFASLYSSKRTFLGRSRTLFHHHQSTWQHRSGGQRPAAVTGGRRLGHRFPCSLRRRVTFYDFHFFCSTCLHDNRRLSQMIPRSAFQLLEGYSLCLTTFDEGVTAGRLTIHMGLLWQMVVCRVVVYGWTRRKGKDGRAEDRGRPAPPLLASGRETGRPGNRTPWMDRVSTRGKAKGRAHVLLSLKQGWMVVKSQLMERQNKNTSKRALKAKAKT